MCNYNKSIIFEISSLSPHLAEIAHWIHKSLKRNNQINFVSQGREMIQVQEQWWICPEHIHHLDEWITKKGEIFMSGTSGRLIILCFGGCFWIASTHEA